MLCFSQEVKNALLIANDTYSGSIRPLDEPVREARNLKLALESIGFKCTIVENADREKMYESLRIFREKCEKEEGIAFFHYGGHAVQIDGVNYLLPSNTQLDNVKQVPYSCVNVNDVMDHMQGDANIVVLDSCRNNPFSSGTRGGATSRGLAAITKKPVNSIIVYSADVDEVAEDGVFTPILTQYITEKNVSMEDILKKVRLEVLNKTDHRQLTGDYSRLKYSIYLAGNDNASIVRKTLKGFLEMSTYTPCSVYMDISNIGDVKGFSSERFDIPSGAHRIKVKYKDGTVESRDVIINPEVCEKWKLTYLSKEQLAVCVELGEQYRLGKGGAEKNLKKAFEYYKMAADRGDAQGECGAGLCFEEGLDIEKNGLTHNEMKAFEWYKKASSKGHGEAMYRLGMFYHYGKGKVKKDYTVAKQWYEKAIATNDSEIVVKEARESLNELMPFISQVGQSEKKDEKQETEQIGYTPAFYSFGIGIAYSFSDFNTKNNFIKFNAHGIKLKLMFAKLHIGHFEAKFQSGYSFCRSYNLISETIDYHDFSIMEFKLGGAFRWGAFHITVFQPSCHVRSITHNSVHVVKNELDTDTGAGYWGFKFGVDLEFRIRDYVSFYVEYNTPKISVGKMDDTYLMEHSISLGININFANAY